MAKSPVIYMDHNATTPVLPEVAAKIYAQSLAPYNPSSVHSQGRQAKAVIESSRRKILDALGVSQGSHDLIFTASGTEANNLALKGCSANDIWVGATEHASVFVHAENADRIEVDANGHIDLQRLESRLQAYAAAQDISKLVVSVMWANNETGVIQPLVPIVGLVKHYGALLHCDAVQAFGKVPVDLGTYDIDMVTISSHKIGGSQGAAALIVKKSIKLYAQIQGGGQERGLRAGTENVLAVYGFGEAVSQLNTLLDSMQVLKGLRDGLEQHICNAFKEAVIVGKDVSRLPNTSCIIFPGINNQTQLMHCDSAKIAISSGAACSSGKVESSHVLQAMGIRPDDANCAIRVSLGLGNTQEDIDQFITVWSQLARRLLDAA